MRWQERYLDFRWLVGFLAWAGVGIFPPAGKTVAEWFPKKERAVATGIFNAGPSVGVVLSLLTVPFILRYLGWKEVFWITGGIGFVWLAAWLAFYDLPT